MDLDKRQGASGVDLEIDKHLVTLRWLNELNDQPSEYLQDECKASLHDLEDYFEASTNIELLSFYKEWKSFAILLISYYCTYFFVRTRDIFFDRATPKIVLLEVLVSLGAMMLVPFSVLLYLLLPQLLKPIARIVGLAVVAIHVSAFAVVYGTIRDREVMPLLTSGAFGATITVLIVLYLLQPFGYAYFTIIRFILKSSPERKSATLLTAYLTYAASIKDLSERKGEGVDSVNAAKSIVVFIALAFYWETSGGRFAHKLADVLRTLGRVNGHMYYCLTLSRKITFEAKVQIGRIIGSYVYDCLRKEERAADSLAELNLPESLISRFRTGEVMRVILSYSLLIIIFWWPFGKAFEPLVDASQLIVNGVSFHTLIKIMIFFAIIYDVVSRLNPNLKGFLHNKGGM